MVGIEIEKDYKKIVGASSSGTTNLGNFTFSIPTVSTDTTYKIKFFISAMETPDDEPQSIPDETNTATITVKAPVQQPDPQPEQPTNPGTTTPQEPETPKKSTNADLKDLGIKPKTYDFRDFVPSRTTPSYTATVPNNIEDIEVYYQLPSGSKSKVQITAEKGLKVSNGKVSGLKEGKNTITITVTAEAGNTKTYTIVVTRKTADEPVETPTDEPTVEEPKEDLEQTTPEENNEPTEAGEGIKTLSIAGITLTPEFSTDVYDYDAVLKENKDTLEIKAETTSEDYRVVIAGNEELKDGENIITLIVYDAQNAVVATYQVTVMKNTVDQNEINSIFGQIKKEEMMKTIAIIAVIALIVILLIIYIVMKAKMKKKNDKEGKNEKRNKEDLDEEFFRNFIDDKEKNETPNDEIIQNSILIEDEEEKTEEKTTTRRGRRSKIETEEDDSTEDKNKTEKESTTETKSRRKKEESKIETEEKDFENNFKIEEIEDISNTSQTEKRKGKHF